MKALPGRMQIKGGLRRWSFLLYVPAILFSLSLTGCLTQGSGEEGGTDVVADPDEVRPPLTTPERTICDPFNAGTTLRDRGLVGNLVYLTDDMPRYTSVRDYIDNGVPVQSTLYFDKIFIPTRRFDLGFYTQEGQVVLNHRDEPLYEYFGVRLETQLQLAEGEPSGWYQLSVLSDDGAILYRKNADGSLTQIVNNDGTHPTRMGCANSAVYMEAGQKLPVVLEYYQGPRYHISMIVMWRPLPADQQPNQPVSDVTCGRQGNSLFFNSNVTPSQPTATWYDLLTRGWKPLENANIYFHEQASNPCAAEDPLLISNFAITSTTRTSVTVSWVTNKPATSKAEVKNVTTGAIIQSPEDTTLKTSHSVTIPGLTANTLYAVKGISSTSTQTIVSDERAFRTPR